MTPLELLVDLLAQVQPALTAVGVACLGTLFTMAVADDLDTYH